MAFKFRSKSSLQISKQPQSKEQTGNSVNDGLPKLTNAQLNKLTKVFPSWLRDNSGLKQLPGIYQGVLGQVQLQPVINISSPLGRSQILADGQHRVDYMNRFTDTERVHQLLSASQLSDETLATIWAHVNKTYPGKLTNREVCLALALIAIFQKLDKEQQGGSSVCRASQPSSLDPFSLVRLERKPPVPKLLSNRGHAPDTQPIKPSKSTPANLDSGILLVDFQDDDDDDKNEKGKPLVICETDLCDKAASTRNPSIQLFDTRAEKCLHAISLIDMDGDKFGDVLIKLTQTWMSILRVLKATFKRSYDILNVENSRQSSIEALRSKRGQQFSKHLCVCYPLAHNIKFKVDELNCMQLYSIDGREKTSLFHKDYTVQINDLITSINEYWAVLINLFNESGQTRFIELIMDGLNCDRQTVFSATIDELVNELDGAGKTGICSICHAKSYLINCDTLGKGLSLDEAELVSDSEVLLTNDNLYYYHPKCANFWLNQVDPNGLPFTKSFDDTILSPASLIRS